VRHVVSKKHFELGIWELPEPRLAPVNISSWAMDELTKINYSGLN
jgi:hypothetical protein